MLLSPITLLQQRQHKYLIFQCGKAVSILLSDFNVHHSFPCPVVAERPCFTEVFGYYDKGTCEAFELNQGIFESSELDCTD